MSQPLRSSTANQGLSVLSVIKQFSTSVLRLPSTARTDEQGPLQLGLLLHTDDSYVGWARARFTSETK